jgi:hypothetical protein
VKSAPATLAQRTLIDQSQLIANLLEELGGLKGKKASKAYVPHVRITSNIQQTVETRLPEAIFLKATQDENILC